MIRRKAGGEADCRIGSVKNQQCDTFEGEFLFSLHRCGQKLDVDVCLVCHHIDCQAICGSAQLSAGRLTIQRRILGLDPSTARRGF